jgi:hypothetical protein
VSCTWITVCAELNRARTPGSWSGWRLHRSPFDLRSVNVAALGGNLEQAAREARAGSIWD